MEKENVGEVKKHTLKKLKKNNASIIFRKDAIVSLIPRKNFKEAFYMFYRFSKGDSEGKILRPKVLLLFSLPAHLSKLPKSDSLFYLTTYLISRLIKLTG